MPSRKPRSAAERAAKVRKAIASSAKASARGAAKEAREKAAAEKKQAILDRRAAYEATVQQELRKRADRVRKQTSVAGKAKPLTSAIRADRARGIAEKLRLDQAKARLPKPPYRIPPMAEIEAIPPNGFKAVSTFSGCGGSCLGLRMAGYRVLWASEFIPLAQQAYRANHPHATLDTRDVRLVRPEEILEAAGIAPGELDLFEGSPPCSSFSTAGKREKLWGKAKNYSSGVKQRTDDLFQEWLRLAEGLRPKVMLAENVPGLSYTAASGVLREILARIRGLGYRVQYAILNAAEHGVPQSRERLFIQAVRDDLNLDPAWPEARPYRYLIHEAWDGVPDGHKEWCHGSKVETYWNEILPGEDHPRRFTLRRLSFHQVCTTITQTMGDASGKCSRPSTTMHPSECRYLTLPEVRRICGFPDDFILPGTFAQGYERLGRAVPPPLMAAVSGAIRDKVLARC